MMSRTLLFACLLGLAVLSQADRPKTCPAGCPLMQEGKIEGKKPPVLRCKPCSPGYYTATVGACCTECKDGIITVNSATNTATCTPCPKGSEPKKSSSGAITCMCKSGSQANGTDPVTGVSGCDKCAAGTYNPNKTQALNACQACPADLVSGAGADKCFACPLTTAATIDQTGCVCDSNYYVVPAPPKPSPKPGRKWRSFGEVGDKDGVKIPLCLRCADPTANGAPNMWPACCAAGSSWNGTACVALCPPGADYVNGVCTCADGATFDSATQECVCGDGTATWGPDLKVCMCPGSGSIWDNVALTCSCPGGASFVNNDCSCNAGASWDGANCNCPNGGSWDVAQQTCTCSNGATWDATTTCCPLATWDATTSSCTCGNEATSGATWNGATLTCDCTSGGTWDSASQACTP